MLNKLIASCIPYMPKQLIWIFSKRYIAGETTADAILAAKKLNKQGIKVTVDLLGEFIQNLDQAKENKEAYLEIINEFEKNKIDGNYSLKPSFFGLLIDKQVCYQNIRDVVAKAADHDNFIRIDMEDSGCVDNEIELFRKLKAEFPDNVGLVLQAYLKRTLSDVDSMMDLKTVNSNINYRLCKGIYVESEKIAYKKYEKVNENYLEILDKLFTNKIYPAIATHDKFLVEKVYLLIEKHKLKSYQYEFQMLYGVTPELRKNIVNKGHTMRVYIPFGKDWFGYSSRRLKENPKIASLIIKALFSRG